MKGLSGQEIAIIAGIVVLLLSKCKDNDTVDLWGDILSFAGAALTLIGNRNAFLESKKDDEPKNARCISSE